MSTENIKKIYEKHTTTKSADMVTPILFFLLVLSVFVHLYTTVQKKLIHANWDDQQCNPKYLFFSGFLNPLDRNPWTTTQSNFQKCVATRMYQDPNLTKEINRNKVFIKKNDENIRKTLETERKLVREINEKWIGVLDSKQMDLNDIATDKDKRFTEHGFLYSELSKKTTQLFKVLQSILIYVQGILIYKVSDYKKNMDFDKTHSDFMAKYTTNYEKYKQSYAYLDQGKWTDAINTARDTIDNYVKMTKEVDDYMTKHMYMVSSITESCYQLRYNMDNDSCSSKIFPNINNELIALYPTLNKIFD